MPSSTLKEDDLSEQFTKLIYPRSSHCAIICGQTGCGKTEFILDLLETDYCNVFEHVVIICPTWKDNKTYLRRKWIYTDPEVYMIDPRDKKGDNRLHDWLRYCHEAFSNEETLYIIDDCASSKALTTKKDKLTDLAYSGRHTLQSVWILTQKYNSVLTDFREQAKWIALFYCKDRDSFAECLRENDVVPIQYQQHLRIKLSQRKHSKLILKTEQPTGYKLIY